MDVGNMSTLDSDDANRYSSVAEYAARLNAASVIATTCLGIKHPLFQSDSSIEFPMYCMVHVYV